MSLRRFQGWEPTETRTVINPDGTTATMTVTREPEFDESDREALYTLWADELERCPQCGNPRSVCSQFPDAGIFPQKDVCWVTAVRENAQRKFHTKHEDAKPDAAGFLPGDGVTIWASLVDRQPDEDFLA